MAATTGFGEPSIRSSTEWSDGSTGGLPNSVMSAPAMNVRPAHTMTMACTTPSAVACLIPSWSPLRTCWLSALTGGLSTVRTATRPRVERSTDCVIFALSELLSRGGGSAAQLLGQVLEVLRDDIPLAGRGDVAVRARPVLVRPRHERGAQADLAGLAEVAVVGGDHHALAGRQPQELGSCPVALGLRFVVPRHLGAEDRVPRKPAVLGHVHHEGHVAVRERGQHELPLQACEPGHRVGPGIEAVPGAIEVIDLGLRKTLDAELGQELVEALPVEVVELGPRPAAATHLVHRRLVEPAPRVGELGPVEAEPLRLAERLAFPDEAQPPVDHRAEDVERERLDVGDCHGKVSLSRLENAGALEDRAKLCARDVVEGRTRTSNSTSVTML